MNVTLLPGSGIVENIPLDRLISLEEAGLEYGFFPERDLDNDHIQVLANLKAEELPAISVVNVSIDGAVRQAIVDGNHRKEAAVMRKDTVISSIAKTYNSEAEVVRDAFEANYKHGLRASKKTRSDYALWLYVTNPDMSYREIARIAKLNVSTVSRAVKNFEDDTEKASPEVTATKKLLTALRKFYKDERTFFGSFGKGNSEKANNHRADALYKYIATLPKTEHPTIVQELASLNDTLTVFMNKVSQGATKKK